MNYPLLAKCYFGNIRVANTQTGTAFTITAGIYGGNQQTSGPNVLDQIRLESNLRDGMLLSYCQNTLVNGWSSEDQPSSNGVYTAFAVNHGSVVYATGVAPGRSGTTNKHLYGVKTEGAFATFRDSPLAVSCTGTSVYTDSGITLVNCQLLSISDVTFLTVGARNASTLIDVRDTANVPLVWPGSTPFYSREAYGVLTGTLRCSNNFFLADLQDGLGVGGADGYVMVLKNATTPPAANPAAGYGVLYMQGGALKFKSANGTVTTMGPL
jgi:hypothetical protein